MANWSFHNPVRVHFGSGQRARLADMLQGRRVLAVSTARGRRQIEGDGLLAAAVGRAAALSWVDTVMPNPGLRDTQGQIDRLTGQGFDTVLALGGGSALDAAKALAAGLAPEAASRDLAALIAGAGKGMVQDCLPMIALPTTSGTGAEVTPFATIWNHEAKKKLSLGAPLLFPHTAIIDPDLTLGLPADPTMATGLDAVNQAFESVWNRNRTPLSLGFAGRAIGLGLRALPLLAADLADRRARADIAQASLLAGLAISQTRTAVCHAMSYPLTAHFDLAHGWACAATMGAVARWVLEADPAIYDAVCGSAGCADGAELVDRLGAVLEALDVRGTVSGKVPGRAAALALIPEMYTPGRSDNFMLDLTPEALQDVLEASLV